ncbi:flagellar biosynthetic protein FliR [Microvirga flocculans]|uniref:Flagellar biosynthetic protein FliR n=1 Tax=Microvirga flocculans TaxID=217168 RepID=A0A7W6IGL0_9HYPH|nr:flagellar biosynthesis protein FliR [Microvirga flocculans]MBB4040781.1 flagellar biosynthetic protein FliR [Microvirga flocculans]
MSEITSETLLGVFLIVCRVGGCLMIVPGFSSYRIPVQVRLFIALSVSLALSPVLLEPVRAGIASQAPAQMLVSIGSELLTGLLIGLLGRVYFLALQTLLGAVAMALGLGGMPGTPIDESEPLPPISSFIMMVATAVLFLSDLHWEIFRGLIASYSRLPMGELLVTRISLTQLVDQIGIAFVLALRISSPFILYSVVVNLAVGLTNKLTPQIPVYFLATPFVMLGGLLIMYFAASDYVLLFMEAFSTWLRDG